MVTQPSNAEIDFGEGEIEAFEQDSDSEEEEDPEEEEGFKKFKHDLKRNGTMNELRRRRYFEDHQEMVKRRTRQKFEARRISRFDKYIPRMTDDTSDSGAWDSLFETAPARQDLIGSADWSTDAPYNDDFGASFDRPYLDDGDGQFQSGPLFGLSTKPFARRRPNLEELVQTQETTIGRWGSRMPSDKDKQSRTGVKNDPSQPLTARARKAARALNAQAKQSASLPGKGVTAKNQPKNQQQAAPSNNGAGKIGSLPITDAQLQQQRPPGQMPAPRKRWQTQRQKKTRAPGSDFSSSSGSNPYESVSKAKEPASVAG